MELSIQQFIDAWRVLCAAAPGYACHSQTGAECLFSGMPIAFFNAVILTGRGLSFDALQTQAENARAWADGRGVPWTLIVTQEAVHTGVDHSASLAACGYAQVMPLTGMLAQRVAPVERVPDGLELNLATDDAACAAILDVNAAAYAMSFDAAHEVWGKAAFWRHHTGVLGSTGGRPVTSTAVMKVAGHRYVALVATVPSQQRRGYADAAMRYALELSRESYGELPTFLHSSEAGRPVYERMGYQTVARHYIYMDQKFLGEH